MKLLSVNIGAARAMSEAKINGTTGIYKTPIDAPAYVGALGLTGDAVCDTKNHGGPDQAVYLYGAPDYAWWAAAVGAELEPGTFGENLTIDGLESAAAWVGDRLRIGEVLLEVTAPRIPCHILARRMEDAQFVTKFRDAALPGVYCRVLEPGYVQAGQAVEYARAANPIVSIVEMFRDYYAPTHDAATLRRFLSAPIAARSRAALEKRTSAAA
jgi:MOSC domain-containing protein YiiM